MNAWGLIEVPSKEWKMSVFYVFDKVSLRKVGNVYGYKSLRGAKVGLAAYKKSRPNPLLWENLVVGTELEYNALDYEVPTYNCLNPEAGTFMIKRSLKGTCCDPATESYHSM
jgi:hypothetical protein